LRSPPPDTEKSKKQKGKRRNKRKREESDKTTTPTRDTGRQGHPPRAAAPAETQTERAHRRREKSPETRANTLKKLAHREELRARE
jgi:hypothetical protein